jgi:NAD(P)-dependent dehydrogenase (short-subunit alcohol dehydrogenase family)
MGMKVDFRLDDRVAVITGAAGDIGAATAQLMAARGAKIVAVDRDAAGLERLAERMPVSAALLPIVADVADEAQVANYVEQARRTFGRIDIFFNNAGIEGSRTGAWCLIPDLTLDDFRQIISVNLIGVFLGLKHVIPLMVDGGGGAIVNTSSINGLKGSRGQVAYVASKHAVVGMTQVTAKEWAAKGVRVNAVAPASIVGRMMNDYLEIVRANAPQPPQGERLRYRPPPIARQSDPHETATVVAFLCSDMASYITGACYSVDGGMIAM